MKVTCYRVTDWELHYENNRTREMKEMKWVPFKNSHDGEGYCQMVEGDLGASVLGAFVACVEVASRCQPRGTLLRKGNLPHDAVSLASRTRLSLVAFEEMLKRAIKPTVAWLELIEIEVDTVESPLSRSLPAVIPHPSAVSSVPFHSIPFPSEEGVQGGKIEVAVPIRGFVVPELAEVIAEGVRIMLSAEECEKFIDHYTANGWRVGRNPMKSWQSSLRNWNRNVRAGTYSNNGAKNSNGAHRKNYANDPNARREAQRAEQYNERIELPPNLLDSADAAPRV